MVSSYPKSKEERKAMFDTYDPNGNNLMSLAELDKMCVQEPCFGEYNIKPVLMRAYKKADKFGSREGLITRGEFRKFLDLLPVYKQLWEYFEKIDIDSDRRVNLEEFKAGAKHI